MLDALLTFFCLTDSFSLSFSFVVDPPRFALTTSLLLLLLIESPPRKNNLLEDNKDDDDDGVLGEDEAERPEDFLKDKRKKNLLIM